MIQRVLTRWQWPTIGLLIGILVGGAAVYQEWPATSPHALGRSDSVAAELRGQTPTLKAIGEETRKVASVVEPSVVYITIKAKPSNSRISRRGIGPQPDAEFFRRLPPQFRQFFGDPEQFGQPDEPNQRDEEAQPEDRYEQYNVPRQVGAGSGWVWDDQGHIITNNHVVQDADEIEVVFYDESRATATVVGTDPKTDVAVLKVDREALTPALRTKDRVEQGDMVFAFGSPLRYRFSMSQGVVSGVGRQVGVTGQDGYEKFIQTDAAINPGNSGGPLTNIYGEVVGMNTAIATGTGFFAGIGFAIPMDVVEPTVRELIDSGQVSRGFIGVMIRDDADLLATYDVDHGAVVAGLVDDGPAADAGLEIGDVILSIDDQEVKDAADLRWIVAGKDPGERIGLELLRNGNRKQIRLKLGELPSARPQARASSSSEPEQDGDVSETLQKLGLSAVRTVTRSLAERYTLQIDEGVFVENVRTGSIAAVRGLQPGMVITHVMNDKVKTVEDLNRLVDKYGQDGKPMRLRVRDRSGQPNFVVVTVPD